MKSNNANIFLSGTLLRLDQTSCSVKAHDQAAGDFGVKRPTVTGFLNSGLGFRQRLWSPETGIDSLPQYAFDPRNYFVT